MPSVTSPALPDTDEPVADILDRRCKAFERQHARAKAERWLPITFPEHRGQPFGVVWFGDPHLDDDGANLPLLRRHIAEVTKTPGMYSACVGDFTNNWVGRLVRLYMDQQTTHRDAKRLAAWFLNNPKLRWALATMGNHDLWNEGEAILGLISPRAMYMPAWEARVEFRAGRDAWRVHCAHDFKGSSVYNKTHGPAKAALFSGGAAELYVAGHKHTLGGQVMEHEETGTVSNVIRCRGYKHFDRHAIQNGFPEGQAGASIVTIFHPNAKSAAGRISVYYDVALGCSVLRALRKG